MGCNELAGTSVETPFEDRLASAGMRSISILQVEEISQPSDIAVTLTCVREVLVSNFDQKTGYLYEGFLQSLQKNASKIPRSS
jgi:hypothetical protein